MKKLLVFFVIMIALASCHPLPTKHLSTNEIRSNDDDIINTMLIDGCEYITWRRWEGGYNSYSSGIVHKGNCKNHK